jgi:hypothetical protein
MRTPVLQLTAAQILVKGTHTIDNRSIVHHVTQIIDAHAADVDPPHLQMRAVVNLAY